MVAPPPANDVKDNYSMPLLLTLIAAGLAGNYFKFPIFFSIDFLFGSIFALLALQFLGLARGILAAAIIAGYTYFLWNHPYAIIIMTAEVAVVGLLTGRRKMGMVLADTLYWLIIGMPLAYLFYHFAMQLTFSNTYIAMTKQAVNGIANALVARLIFTGYKLRSRSPLTSYSEIFYNLLAFFVLYPALILLAIGSRADFTETDLQIRTMLKHDSHLEVHRLEIWLMNRQSAIINLAKMSASTSPQQMQSYLEQAKKSDVNFQRVGLLDREANVTAMYPLIDELGHNNIGKNFSDRPFIPRLKATLRPMFSEVVQGRIGIPKPVVAMLAPVVNRGAYQGYVIGVLSLQQLQDYLDVLAKSPQQNATLYTLLDNNGNVIMSNRPDQKVMTPFARDKGTFKRLDDRVSMWAPVVSPNIPYSERWKESFYVEESPIGALSEWKLVLEQPVAPYQKRLYDYYTGKLALLFLILLGALALAELLSRKMVVTLGKLSTLTQEMPVRLATDGNAISWPESGIKEVTQLINNFKKMADSLSAQFHEVRQVNESLEKRVEERTDQLTKIMHELNIILENAPIGIFKNVDRKPIWVNQKAAELFLYAKEEIEFQPNRKLYPSNEAFEKFDQDACPILKQGLVFESVQDLVRKDGVHIMVRCIGKAIEPADLSKGVLWLLEDFTERMRGEEELRESEQKYRQLNETLEQRIKEAVGELCDKDKMLTIQGRQAVMGEMINNISHQWRQPLNMLGLLAQELQVTHKNGQFSSEYIDANVKKTMEIINHMSKTIDDFTNFFKSDKEKVQFNVLDIIKKTISLLEGSFAAQGIRTDIKTTGESTITGYPNELAQVLLNIVNNARDAFLAGKVSNPTIMIRLWTEGDRTIVTINDNAGGIPEGIIDKIFEPYFTTKGPDKGTGIGLYMSKTIIEKNMKGTLSVRNVADGAEFRIEI